MKSLFLIGLVLLLTGCGATTSSVPVYPADWPALVKTDNSKTLPDMSGTYYALSDPIGPLVYPQFGAPVEIFFFVPIGAPDIPQLGRRVLPWHLAVHSSDQQRESLARFDAALQKAYAQGGAAAGIGWVRLSRSANGAFDVRCGLDQTTTVSFTLSPASPQSFLQSIWSTPDGYTIEDGAIVTNSVIATSPLERKADSAASLGNAAGHFRFWRAADGSLVMLENLYWEYSMPGRGSLVFQKWWRWRPVLVVGAQAPK